jgi:hypothetical protein
LAIDLMGGLLGMLDPLTKVANYLKNVKETREVKERLGRVLASITLYEKSAEASHKSGKALADRLETLDPPLTSQEAVEVLTMCAKFFQDYRGIFASIRQFGKECRALNSGDLEAFMEKVHRTMPDVFDFMNYFGRNYDPKTDTQDLTNLPMVMRAWGPKSLWKEDEDLSKTVKEGKEFMDRIMKKFAVIRTQKIVIRDRRPVLVFVRSLEDLAREAKKLKATKETSVELRKQAPSWFIGVVSILDDVKKALPGRSTPVLR